MKAVFCILFCTSYGLKLGQDPQFEITGALYDAECGNRFVAKCWKKGGHSTDKDWTHRNDCGGIHEDNVGFRTGVTLDEEGCDLTVLDVSGFHDGEGWKHSEEDCYDVCVTGKNPDTGAVIYKNAPCKYFSYKPGSGTNCRLTSATDCTLRMSGQPGYQSYYLKNNPPHSCPAPCATDGSTKSSKRCTCYFADEITDSQDPPVTHKENEPITCPEQKICVPNAGITGATNAAGIVDLVCID